MTYVHNVKFRTRPTRKKKVDNADAEGESIIAVNFGDLITADHFILGSESDFSRHGDTAALGCQDFASKWIGGYPAPRKTAEESIKALQHFVGNEIVNLFYTDGSPELEAASNYIGYPHDVSTPHRPQNNGESMVRKIIEGTRCCLLASGLGHVWWKEAMYASFLFLFFLLSS